MLVCVGRVTVESSVALTSVSVRTEIDHPVDIASRQTVENHISTLEGEIKSLSDRMEKLENKTKAINEKTAQISAIRALFYYLPEQKQHRQRQDA
jgi:flagellar biosynthesis chaperone FliJ